MEASKFTMKNLDQERRGADVTNPQRARCRLSLLVLSAAAVIALACSLVYYTDARLWMEGFLNKEMRKAVYFFVSCYKIMVFLFSADKEGELTKLLTGPGGELSKNTLFANALFSAKEVHEKVSKVDWLYWALLFIPFHLLYVIAQESFLKLRTNVRCLKDDCRLKNSFINWQNCMHMAMHQRIAELRIEVKTLNTLLAGYRQNMKDDHLRKLSTQFSGENGQTETPCRKIMEDSSENHLAPKKNKSDSLIGERKDQVESVNRMNRKPRPKTEESKYSIEESHKKPAWTETRKRLQERTRELLKARADIIRAAKVEEPQQISESMVSEDESKPVMPQKPAMPVEKRIALARSKFTSRKVADENKSLEPRETKIPQNVVAVKNNNTMLSKNHTSGVKTRSMMKQETSQSATELSQSENSFHPITANKRSRSEAATSDASSKRTTSLRPSSQSEIESPSFASEDDIVANLGFEGIGKVTSYTEVFKKKVQLTKGGKPPEITIEGRRRWCF